MPQYRLSLIILIISYLSIITNQNEVWKSGEYHKQKQQLWKSGESTDKRIRYSCGAAKGRLKCSRQDAHVSFETADTSIA